MLAGTLAACTSASKAVRPSVVLILDHLDAYEQGLDTRIAAEQKYYAAHTNTLDRAARQATLIARDVRQRELIFAYADAARSDGAPLRLSRLMQLLATADDEFGRALTEYVKLSTEGRTEAAQAFATLETRRVAIAGVRSALQPILAGDDLGARVKFWADYIGKVKDEIDKAQKAEDDKTKATANP
jgi:hypothetical protein